MRNKRIFRTVLLLCVLMACIAGAFFARYYEKSHSVDLSKFHGTLLQQPRDISPFTLTGIDGQVFNRQQLLGHWTMMFFGFTHCQSMCPIVMHTLGDMMRQLEMAHVKPLPRVVMITLDPARDTQAQLQRFVTAFHPAFYGARGEDVHAIQTLTEELGIAYVSVRPEEKNATRRDDIEHTGAIILFNPEGKVIAFFTTPHRAKALAADYQLLLKASQS